MFVQSERNICWIKKCAKERKEEKIKRGQSDKKKSIPEAKENIKESERKVINWKCVIYFLCYIFPLSGRVQCGNFFYINFCTYSERAEEESISQASMQKGHLFTFFFERPYITWAQHKLKVLFYHLSRQNLRESSKDFPRLRQEAKLLQKTFLRNIVKEKSKKTSKVIIYIVYHFPTKSNK